MQCIFVNGYLLKKLFIATPALHPVFCTDRVQFGTTDRHHINNRWLYDRIVRNPASSIRMIMTLPLYPYAK